LELALLRRDMTRVSALMLLSSLALRFNELSFETCPSIVYIRHWMSVGILGLGTFFPGVILICPSEKISPRELEGKVDIA
jgi:hypothetical protein